MKIRPLLALTVGAMATLGTTAALRAFAHGDYRFGPAVPVRGALNHAHRIRRDIGSENLLKIFAGNQHVGGILPRAQQPIHLVGPGIVAGDQLVGLGGEIDLAVRKDHAVRPPQRTERNPPDFLLRGYIDHGNGAAGFAISIVSHEGEFTIARGHDFVRPVAGAYPAEHSTARGINNRERVIGFVQHQQQVRRCDISPDGREVWAANSQDGTVSIIDTRTSKVNATLDIQTKHSNRLKFTLDGELALVSDAEGNEVVVVETATRRVRKRIKTGKVPLGILMEPGGARAYVATTGSNAVDVIDLKTLEVVHHLAAGNEPDGLAWSHSQ